MFVYLRNALCVFCTVSFISACSGSGSGGLPSDSKVESPPTTTTTPRSSPDTPPTLTLSGNIVKGTVSNAQVDFYLVREGQVESQSLATVYSDAMGSFSAQLEIADTADLILIRAVGQGQRQTQMLCDAAQCGSTEVIDGVDSNDDGLITLGESLYLSEDFELSSVVSIPENSDSLSTSLTPLTHIAVSQARKQALLTRETVEVYMQHLANLMNLPTTLTQLSAIDSARLVELIAKGNVEVEDGSVIYSVYSAMFAEYANQNKLTIEAAIEEVSEGLFTDSLEVSFDRNMVLIILQNALEVASLYAGRDESLQGLISEVRLLLVAYYCDEYAVGDNCEIIDPVVPEVPDENELQVVKDFVGDLREWARDVTLQAEPALEKFTQRISMVEDLWEDDLKLLTSSLNDLLPGVAQLVSPYYCWNYAECPFPEYLPDNQRRLNWRGLEFTLDNNTGELTVVGELDGEVDVNVDLQLPPLYYWEDEQRIAITAGRLSHGKADLLLTEGSEVVASFTEGLGFSTLMSQISNPYFSPAPSAMTVNTNFLLQTEYERALESTIGFEPGEVTNLPVNFSGDWAVTTDRAHGGEASLRSRHIFHRQNSRVSAAFNTKGGDLEFYFALESESNFDYLHVYLDGQLLSLYSGLMPQFRRHVLYIPPGEHTVTWEYIKDGSVDSYADAAWIDSITFPPFADADLPTEFETRTILNGTLSLSAEKLDQPWVWATKGFLPADISINAILSHDMEALFSDEPTADTSDTLSVRLSANVANAADFVPPQELDYGTLVVLGDYSITGDIFTLNLPNQRFEVEKYGASRYQYREYRAGEVEPVDSRYYYFYGDEVDGLADVAGRVIAGSAVGWRIVVPEEGLYLSTLLGSSPWTPPLYPESRFDPEGGNVFGYLVQAYQPTETAAQYLRLSAAVEVDAKIDGLEHTVLGTAFTRESLTEGDLGFYIEYDGQRFNFESEAWYTPDTYEQESGLALPNPNLTITNQQGVELFVQLDITLDGENDEQEKETLTGEISYNGSVYATLERIKGLTVIRYIDGSGESLE